MGCRGFIFLKFQGFESLKPPPVGIWWVDFGAPSGLQRCDVESTFTLGSTVPSTKRSFYKRAWRKPVLPSIVRTLTLVYCILYKEIPWLTQWNQVFFTAQIHTICDKTPARNTTSPQKKMTSNLCHIHFFTNLPLFRWKSVHPTFGSKIAKRQVQRGLFSVRFLDLPHHLKNSSTVRVEMPGRNESERNMAEIKLSRWKVIGKSFFFVHCFLGIQRFCFLECSKKIVVVPLPEVHIIPHIEVIPTKHDKSKLGYSPGCNLHHQENMTFGDPKTTVKGSEIRRSPPSLYL